VMSVQPTSAKCMVPQLAGSAAEAVPIVIAERTAARDAVIKLIFIIVWLPVERSQATTIKQHFQATTAYLRRFDGAVCDVRVFLDRNRPPAGFL
jgi:hypothetical protein